MYRGIVLFLTILSVTCEQTSDVKGCACEDLAKEMQALKEAFAQFQQNEELQNATIEERVTLLETQMEIVNGAIADIEDDVDNLEGQVTVLFGDQVIQDEQLLELGIATENLEVISEQLSVSVAELQTGQSQINSTVLGIDATVIEIDGRVFKMEQNGTVAFNADLGQYTSISLDTVVVFQQVNLNIGDGYDSTTGQFTVPPGGDGLYYFYAHFRVNAPKFARLDIRRNGGVFCVVWEDERDGNDSPASSCGAVITLVEGDVVEIFYNNGSDDFPVVSNNNPFCSFTGELTKEVQAVKETVAQLYEVLTELKNATIEERVTLFETQMEIANDAIADIEDNVDNLEGQVTVLFGDQVIQDEQLLELGIATENLEVISVQLSVSVAELQTGQSQINSTVVGIDATITEIDERVIKMEQNGSVAFNADLGVYTSIPLDTVVVFQQVNLNLGDGYDSTTGQFTVPPGGDGLYYFYAHFHVNGPKFARFDIRRNGGVFCVVREDERNGNDNPASLCGAVVTLVEGDVVDVFYQNGTDDVPVVSHNIPFCGFTGVRIAPL